MSPTPAQTTRTREIPGGISHGEWIRIYRHNRYVTTCFANNQFLAKMKILLFCSCWLSQSFQKQFAKTPAAFGGRSSHQLHLRCTPILHLQMPLLS